MCATGGHKSLLTLSEHFLRTGETRRSRRRWSEESKLRVVAGAAVLGMFAAAMVRRYDLNASLLFNRKRCYGVSVRFLPAEISEPRLPVPWARGQPLRSSIAVAFSIEILLGIGHRIAVKCCIDTVRVCQVGGCASSRGCLPDYHFGSDRHQGLACGRQD